MYPMIYGHQPILTGTCLGHLYSFRDKHFFKEFNSTIQQYKERIPHYFWLFARNEKSHKRCNPDQTRWMLYKLPVEQDSTSIMQKALNRKYIVCGSYDLITGGLF